MRNNLKKILSVFFLIHILRSVNNANFSLKYGNVVTSDPQT